MGVKNVILHGTMKVNHLGHLEIGNCDTVELVKEFGTPLYVYDVSFIRKRARSFIDTFKKQMLMHK